MLPHDQSRRGCSYLLFYLDSVFSLAVTICRANWIPRVFKIIDYQAKLALHSFNVAVKRNTFLAVFRDCVRITTVTYRSQPLAAIGLIYASPIGLKL